MTEAQPFDQWPSDHFERTYRTEDALGHAFVANLEMQMPHIKRKCAALAPALADAELEAVVREAAYHSVYALLMVLDGVAGTPIDAEHGIEWSLQARILQYAGEAQSVEIPTESGGSVKLSSFRPSKTERIETVKVIPDGDGLCYAYHGWKKGDRKEQEQQNDT